MATGDKEAFAAKITGRNYREELTKQEEQEAKDKGLFVIFGHSDDNVEIRGVEFEEIGAYGGTFLALHKNGILQFHNSGKCPCQFCNYEKIRDRCILVDAVWCDHTNDGAAWTFKTSVAHATFEIFDDSNLYCCGIVIDSADLPSIKE